MAKDAAASLDARWAGQGRALQRTRRLCREVLIMYVDKSETLRAAAVTHSTLRGYQKSERRRDK
jgi:hypothetical protein